MHILTDLVFTHYKVITKESILNLYYFFFNNESTILSQYVGTHCFGAVITIVYFHTKRIYNKWKKKIINEQPS